MELLQCSAERLCPFSWFQVNRKKTIISGGVPRIASGPLRRSRFWWTALVFCCGAEGAQPQKDDACSKERYTQELDTTLGCLAA
jgi:hypothetical protein